MSFISSHSDGLIDRSLDYHKLKRDIKERVGKNCLATGHQPPIITNRYLLGAAISSQLTDEKKQPDAAWVPLSRPL